MVTCVEAMLTKFGAKRMLTGFKLSNAERAAADMLVWL
jgi:hypothetical protein